MKRQRPALSPGVKNILAGFVVAGGLVDSGGFGQERQAEPAEQLAPVPGGRCQD